MLAGTSLVSGLTLPTLVGGSAKPVMVMNKGVDSRVENLQFNKALFRMYKTSALKAKIIYDKIKAGTIPPSLFPSWMAQNQCALGGTPRECAT
jgi:hypothetical protein